MQYISYLVIEKSVYFLNEPHEPVPLSSSHAPSSNSLNLENCLRSHKSSKKNSIMNLNEEDRESVLLPLSDFLSARCIVSLLDDQPAGVSALPCDRMHKLTPDPLGLLGGHIDRDLRNGMMF